MGFDECRHHRKWLAEDVEILKTIRQIIASTFERNKAEGALRRSEQEFRLIAESVPGLFSYVDANEYYRFVNKNYEKWFDLPSSEIVGKHYREVVGDAAYEMIKDRVKMALSGQRVSYENALPYRHGGTRWVLAEYVPNRDNGGKVNGLFALVTDITDLKQTEEALEKNERALKRQTKKLEELNTALKVLLERREQEQREFEENILENVEDLIFPYLEKLEERGFDDRDRAFLGIIRSNLEDLISPFAKTLSSKYSGLTPKETQIADLVRQGKTSKEIASLMDVSLKAIEFHRNNIRRKLGLLHKKANLRTYLDSLVVQETHHTPQ
jgi:PAS domain S-box-containing protein